MSTTGSWNTQDVRAWNRPQKETSRRITFGKAFVSTPRIPLGLNSLDISKDADIRVAATATDITRYSFKASLNTWADTILFSAGASWLEVSPGHLEYQSGEFSTTDDHPWHKPQPMTRRRINFDRPFITPPKVIVFLRQLDMDKNKDWRVATEASGIDPTGFTIQINSWGGSTLYTAIAGWIAYPEDRPYVFSGTASTVGVRFPVKHQLKNSGEINFGGVEFWKPPNVFMAINSLDFGNHADLRIKVKATDVTRAGLIWHMDSWSDSAFYSAGISILAVV